MEKWKQELKSEVVRNAYERYLDRLEAISTVYSVVLYTDAKLKQGGDFINDNEKIRLSDYFSDGFTTIKTKGDIERSSMSGALHQINCTQAIIAILANFENFVDECISIFSVPGAAVRNAKVTTLYGEIDNSSVLKKFAAIHQYLDIESNAFREMEMTTYYKYTLIRNRLVHQQGKLKSGDQILDYWAVDGFLHFDDEAVDSIIHFFLIPLTTFVRALSDVHVNRYT
ncbi:TPA: hypothetical protein P0E24_004873 [Vibrio campbellii]|uniref:RiboL-PSP-HEPN domain-containing protein n=1 Tax=Vibrio pelagius TaxID=28169 RepID=A0ABY5G3I7_VIBPE|nr:hypothetical protein [Vibrio pelagius]UTT84556.1 hypothetical protein LZI70_12850 [Vibrio pelagius]HDM8222169.1 hypothetical protein [Vibrio campbellii]HDM8245698.1 hypothetical protein [Vibrio campbellii]